MKANIWLPGLVMVWGLMTLLTGFVHNFGGLVAIRMALGLCEGGLLPGMASGIYHALDNADGS